MTNLIDIMLMVLGSAMLVAVLWTVYSLFLHKSPRKEPSLLAETVTSLEELYHESPVMMYSLDQHATITRVNKSWLSAMGYLEHEVIGRASRDFMVQEAVPELNKLSRNGLLVELLEQGYLKDLRLQFLRRDKTPLHASISANLLKTTDGQVRGAHCIIIDETKHFIAQSELKARRFQIERTFSSLPIPMFTCTVEGRYLSANNSMLQSMGVTSLAQLNELDHAAYFMQADSRMVESNTTSYSNQGWSLPDVNGIEREVRMNILRITSNSPEPIFEGAFLDVSELEAARRDAARSREYNRALYDTTPVMMYSVDASGTVSDVSEYWLERMGYRRDQVIGRKGLGFFVLEDRDAIREQARQNFARNEAINCAAKLITSDGSRLEGRVHGAPFSDADGKTTGVMCSFIDMTEQNVLARQKRQMEEQLATARKLEAIGQLAAGIAHEINTPSQYIGDNLNFISESLEEIQPLLAYVEHCVQHDCATDADQVRELASNTELSFLLEELSNALAHSREGVASIAQIVMAMKDFSRSGTEELEPIDLNRLIRSVTVVTRNEWKDQAELELALCDDVGEVHCVPSSISQVLLNILINAGQAVADARADDGCDAPLGAIKVSSRVEDAMVCVSIADTGTGMDDATQEKIFNPFFTTRDVGHGRGQGLAVAYRIVTEKHAGSIDVESVPGEGSVFKLTIPRFGGHSEQSAA